MGVKVSGLEFKLFYSDKTYWPDKGDVYHDDVVFKVNGEVLSDDADPGEVADTDIIAFEGGVVRHSPLYRVGIEPSFAAYFGKWQRGRNRRTFVVECSADAFPDLKEIVRCAGGKII